MTMRIGKEEFFVDGQKIVVEAEGENLWERSYMTFTVNVNAGDGDSPEGFEYLVDALTEFRKQCRRFRILERQSYERQEKEILRARIAELHRQIAKPTE